MKIAFRLRTAIVAGALCCSIAGCGRPAQLGNSDKVWATTDALWTAVSSRRTELVAKSAAELEKLHTAGDLTDDAHESLKAVIALTDAGDWTTARKNLRAFVEGQRRER